MTMQTFQCPNCNAPQQYDDHGSPTVVCPYCNSTVIVPEALRYQARTQAPGRSVQFAGDDSLAALTQVGVYIADGKKIEAIKIYRQAFGVDLRTAKEAVEALERGEAVQMTQMSESTMTSGPVGRPVSSGGGSRLGCVLFVVVMVVLVGIGLTFVPLGAIIPSLPAIPGLSGFLDTVLTIGGEEGTGPGFFNDTRWVGADDAGHIYTADFEGGRVQVFDARGDFVQQWFTESQGYISDMVVTRPGVVYILEGGKVRRYDGLTGEPLTQVGGMDDRFDAITVSVEGDIVAVSKEKMMRWNPQGGIMQEVTGIFDNLPDGRRTLIIRDIALDGANNLYVLPVFDAAILKYNRVGEYQDSIGQKGDAAGDFNSPNALAIDGQGRFFVDDFDGMLVLDSAGRHIETIPLGGAAFSLVFDVKNNLYRMDRNGNRVIKYAVLE